jgi:hypothetical protein
MFSAGCEFFSKPFCVKKTFGVKTKSENFDAGPTLKQAKQLLGKSTTVLVILREFLLKCV